MFKKLVIVASVAVLAGCSDSGGGAIDDVTDTVADSTPVDSVPVDTTPVVPPPVDATPVDNTPVDNTPVDNIPVDPDDNVVSANPTGALTGAWFGSTNFGSGVVVIDSNNQLAGLSTNGAGGYEAVHGPVGGSLDRLFHRTSENAAHGDSFTLSGDVPSTVDPTQPDTLTYNLSVVNDGEQLDNTGGPGNFSLTFATTNDIAAVDIGFLTGTWRALTSFCAVDCNLALEMSFDGSGGVGGFTTFNGGGEIPLSGQLVSASPVFMTVSFTWNGQTRNGVVHRDLTDNARIVLNTIGDDGGINKSFSAILTRQ